jgi:hypothetical protein
VSPILVRPVREQLEHDRVIRLLQIRLKRRHEVTINIGDNQTVPVKIGQVQIYPDLLLTSTDRGRKLMGTVEVETAESVNHLEAMAQWAHLGRARAPFHLYVPAGSVDIAKRLAAENHVNVAEIWSFHTIGDQTRFTSVYRAPVSERRTPSLATREKEPAAKPASRPAAAHKVERSISGTRPKTDVRKATISKGASARTSGPARKSAPAKKSVPARSTASKTARRGQKGK